MKITKIDTKQIEKANDSDGSRVFYLDIGAVIYKLSNKCDWIIWFLNNCLLAFEIFCIKCCYGLPANKNGLHIFRVDFWIKII